MNQASPSRTRGFVALGLVVVLVLGIVASVTFAYRRSHLTDKPFSLTNSGDSLENSDVSAVKDVARQFALRIDSLSSSDVNSFFTSVGQVLTTKCRTDLDKSKDVLSSSVGSVAFTTRGYVRSIGIASIDHDSAVVGIVHDSVKTATASKQSLATQNRWTVSEVKVDGKWLVDGFTDPDHGGEFCS